MIIGTNTFSSGFDTMWSELARLSPDRWREHAILLESQTEIRNRLAGLDLYFCPLNALNPKPVPLPSVVTIADIQEAFYPENFTAEALYSRDRHLVGSTRLADCVLTHSEFTKRTLMQKHGLPPDKIVVVHHCANPIFSSSAATKGPARPLPDDFILYPANFWRHKNHDRLLKALRVLRDEHGQTIDLVLTGFPAPNGCPVEMKAREHGVGEQVHILGHIPTEDLADLYCRARILVFPSCFEGFGIPLLEAMACGCPVAAANVTSIPEVVGDAAVLFDPESPAAIAHAVGQLWRDQDLRRLMSERGKRRAAAFSLDGMAQLHLRAFDQAVNAYTRPRYVWRALVYRPYHMARAECRRFGRFIRLKSEPRRASIPGS